MIVIEIAAARHHDQEYEARMWEKEFDELKWEEAKILYGFLFVLLVWVVSFAVGVWWWFRVHP
jgi:hypothetical protein